MSQLGSTDPNPSTNPDGAPPSPDDIRQAAAETAAAEEAAGPDIKTTTDHDNAPAEAKADAIRRRAFEKARGVESPEGKAPPAEDLEDDADAGPASDQTDAKPAPGGESPDQRRELVRARTALEYDGYTDEEIDALKPDQMIRLGGLAHKRAVDRDTKLREAAQARKSSTPGAGNGTGQDSDFATPADGHRAQPGDQIDALLAELDEQNPEQPQGPAQGKPDPEKVKLQEALVRQDRVIKGQNLLEAIRANTGAFPQLRGEKAQDAILAEMYELDPEGKALGNLSKLTQLVKKAAYIAFGPEKFEQARQNRTQNAHRQRDGQPEKPTGGTRQPVKNQDPEALRKAAYEAAKESAAAGESSDKSRGRMKQKLGAGVS